MIAVFRQQSLGPMHAMRADTAGELRIARHQQNEPTRPAKRREPTRDVFALFRAKMAINHCRAARQALGDRDRIGRTQRVCEEIQRRNARGADLAVEPPRLRR